MTFNSLGYLIFLGVVVCAVWRFRHRQQNLLLLIASYWFYASWDWRFLGLLVLSTVLGYSSGIALAASQDEKRRRAILVSRVTLNLAILGVFKYAGFFARSGAELFHAIGLRVGEPTLRIILPIAISYYTFEEISYTMDIYRRKLEPCRDPVAYGLFVAFFPKLAAGPILRPRELLPQIENPRTPPDQADVVSAVGLLLWGLVKKVVIADSLAVYVNQIYGRPSQMSGLSLLIGTLCFAGQIYGDFSGYSDMARGAARLLGFELPLNFRQPYLSSSLTAFWRTWHISLSSWLRDYLYVPLGGNQRSPRRTMVNLMTVMVLGGLWHGAGWVFLIWGAIHGTALAAERLWGGAIDNTYSMPRWRELPRILVTFGIVTLAWVFFRAPSLGVAARVLGRIVTVAPGEMVWGGALWLMVASTVLMAADLIERRTQLRTAANDAELAEIALASGSGGLTGEADTDTARPRGGQGGGAFAGSSRIEVARLLAARPVLAGVLVGLGLVGLIVTSGGSPVPFIYYQF